MQSASIVMPQDTKKLIIDLALFVGLLAVAEHAVESSKASEEANAALTAKLAQDDQTIGTLQTQLSQVQEDQPEELPSDLAQRVNALVNVDPTPTPPETEPTPTSGDTDASGGAVS